MKQHVRLISSIIIGILISATAFASKAKTSNTEYLETVFGRKVEVSNLKRLLQIKDLKQVVSEMEKTGVHFYKVLDPTKTTSTATFSFLSEVPKNLSEELTPHMEGVGSGSALFTTWDGLCCNLGNVIFVSETAEPTTLFHEFTHHLFEKQNRDKTKAISADHKKLSEFLRIYNLRISSALLNDYSFSKRNWRENFDSLIDENSRTFETSRGPDLSEEIAVETGLVKLMLEVNSPHFSLERAKHGLAVYCQANIIDYQSKTMIGDIFGLMDQIKKGTQQPNSDYTEEEGKIREKLYAEITQRLNEYLAKRVGAMQKQVDEANARLNMLQK